MGLFLCLIDFHSCGTVSQNPQGLLPGAIPVPLSPQEVGGIGYLHSHLPLEGVHPTLGSRRTKEKNQRKVSRTSAHILTPSCMPLSEGSSLHHFPNSPGKEGKHETLLCINTENKHARAEEMAQ